MAGTPDLAYYIIFKLPRPASPSSAVEQRVQPALWGAQISDLWWHALAGWHASPLGLGGQASPELCLKSNPARPLNLPVLVYQCSGSCNKMLTEILLLGCWIREWATS